MYKVRISDKALKEIARLDKKVAKQIMSKIEWLARNADLIKPLGLREELSDFSKLRVGDYRVLYLLNADDSIVDVHAVGHRSEIYKK